MFLLTRHPFSARVAAALLLLLPAWIAVQLAIGLADALSQPLEALLGMAIESLFSLPEPLHSMLAGPYGALTMLPFLLLYALPTLMIFVALVWVLRDTGLLVRISALLDPWLQRFGLGSQSLVPVVMGFGCNVPAIIQTRSCSGCERCASASAIAFGAACSYQLPATLAVFGAAGMGYLALPYLVLLALTTLIFLRYALPRQARIASSSPIIARSSPLHAPSLEVLISTIRGALVDFARVALPIFLLVCLLAGLLDWLGVIAGLAGLLAPLMKVFNLPGDASITVLMGAVRKDGIAIGLLAPEQSGLKLPGLSAVQLLTLTYLASVMLPCLVTVLTLVREFAYKSALVMLGRQVAWAIGFSLIIAWTGWGLSVLTGI